MDQGISPERLEDFKRRWKAVFDEELLDTEAILIAARLVAFYKVIMRPLPPQDPAQSEPEAP